MEPKTPSLSGIAFAFISTQLFMLQQVEAEALQTTTAQIRPGSLHASNPATQITNLSVTSLRPLILDFSNNPVINVGKNLNVMKGATIYAVSTNPEVQNAILRANNIFNYGTITSVLPNGGLPGYENALSNLNLSLVATQSLLNKGTISSAGSLSIFSEGSISNSGPQAVMRAQSNVNIFSPNIQNSGHVQSATANIYLNSISSLTATIANLLPTNWQGMINNGFSISGKDGSFSALNGEINLGDTSNKLQNFDILGGDFFSKSLNVNANNVLLNARQISGILNVDAIEFHEFSNSKQLALGKICTVGDPTFYNTGDIQLSGDITVGENLAIIAGGNISSTSAVKSIVARDAQGQGYDIFLIAGAKVSPDCGECSSNAAPGTNANYIVTVDTMNSPGGNIDFSQSTGLQIQANSTNSNRDGANITLAAFQNSKSPFSGGAIKLDSNSVLNSSGNNAGLNGNISIIGAGGIELGAVNASGASGSNANTGIVVISGANPISSNQTSKEIVFDKNGQIISTTNLIPGSFSNSSTVMVGQVKGSSIEISSGMTTLNSDITASNNSGGTIQFKGPVNFGAGAHTVSADATGNANGGSVTIESVTLDPASIVQISANGSGSGNGGRVEVKASNASIGVGLGCISISATGGSVGSLSGNGGEVKASSIKGIEMAGIKASPLGLNGNGAKLSLTSPTVSGTVEADGVGTASGGNIEISASQIDTSDINGTGRISANGGASAGDAGSIKVVNSQAITLNTGGIFANSSGGNGGAIEISTTDLSSKIAGNLPIEANAGGNSNGGSITLVISNGSLNIGNSAGDFSLSAHGGSSGSLAGNGGHILVSGTQVFLDSNFCDASPQGSSGNGGGYGFISTKAALSYSGVPQIKGAGTGSSGYAIAIDKGVTPVLTGLDLTDKSTVSTIQALQSTYPFYFSGELQIQDGIAVGGNLYISSKVNCSNLNGLNIPAGVLVGAITSDFFDIKVTKGSSRIDGIVEFSSLGLEKAQGRVDTQFNPNTFSLTGSLLSDNALALFVSKADISGNMLSPNFITLSIPSGTIDGKIESARVEIIGFSSVQQSTNSVITTHDLSLQSKNINPSISLLGQNQIDLVRSDNVIDSFFLNNTSPLVIMSSISQTELSITNSAKISIPNTISVPSKTTINSPLIELSATINFFGSGAAYISGTQASKIYSTAALHLGPGVITSDGNITFDGSFSSSNLSITAADTLKTEFGTIFQVNDNLTITCTNLINPNAFIAKSITLNVGNSPNGNTIINPYGDLILSSNTIINSNGANLALLARGNIIASGVKSIDLSSKVGNGGSLTAVAGIEIAGDLPRTPNGQSSDPYSIFLLQNGSATGGSISLGRISINTSAKGAYSAGSIILVANKGSMNPATVIAGSIDSSAQNGKGGDILISGPSGILINGSISSKGQSGGGNVQLSTRNIDLNGSEILGGSVTKLQTQFGSSPAGSSIVVNGTIDSSSSFINKSLAPVANGNAGSIQIDASGLVQVSGNINSSGRRGGDIVLQSTSRGVNVFGTINTSGLSPIIAEIAACKNCGNAGDLNLSAASFLQVTGKVTSLGAAASKLSVRAGDGGSITFNTGKIQSSSFYTGAITIGGFIDLSGGAGFSGIVSGNAGNLSSESGTIRITGITQTRFGNASVIASAGKIYTGGSSGLNGTVTIHTYSTQSIPSNFNLASSSKSEYALAGGLFAVNEGQTVVNGSKSNIIIGSTVISKSTESSGVKAGNISYQKFDLSASGSGAVSIAAGGTPLSYSYDDGSTVQSVVITPGSAGHRTKVTPSQAIALYEASNGNAQLFGMNSKGQVSALNLQKTGPSQINLDDTALPSKFSSLQITAQGAPSSVNVDISGNAPFLNASGIQTRLDGTLSFSTAGFNASLYTKSLNIGEKAKLAADSKLNILSSTLLNKGLISVPHLFVQGNNSLTRITNNKTGSFLTTDIGLAATGAGFTLRLSDQNASNPSPNFLFYRPNISVEANKIAERLDAKLNSGKADLGVSSLSPIIVAGNSSSFSSILISNSPINSKSNADVTLGANTNLTASSNLSIRANGITIADDTKLSATNGALQLIASNGKFTIGNRNTLKGVSETLLAKSGSLQIGNANAFSASNGNLIIMSKQQFLAGTQNTFDAIKTKGSPVIELGAGTTTNHVASAHAGKSSQMQIATNISITGTPNYRVNCTTCSQAFGNINLSNNSTTAQATFNGGTLVLDSIGSNPLLIDGASINLYKPVAFSISNHSRIAIKDGNNFELLAGDLFIAPDADLVLENSLANLHIKKNALVSISSHESRISIINCSKRGDVYFKTAAGRIVLEPGEELTLSSRAIGGSELQKQDGIGRRAAKSFAFHNQFHAAVCDVSLVTVLANAKHLERIKHARTSTEKEILNRILKTAGALQTLTARRGAYTAIPRTGKDEGSLAAI